MDARDDEAATEAQVTDTRTVTTTVTLEERVLSQYELLRRIFANLPAASLLRISAVCHMWKSVAETTMRDKDRDSLGSFSWIGPATNGQFYAGHDFLQSPRHRELEAALRVHSRAARMLPETALFMHTTEVFQAAANRTFCADVKAVNEMLPPSCTAVSMAFGGVVGLDAEAGNYVEVENLNPAKPKPALSMMLFPPMPKVKIVPFKLDETLEGLKKHLPGGKKDPDFRGTLLSNITSGKLGESDPVKCVLALTSSGEIPHTHFVLQEIGRRTKNRFAVGGAIGHMPHISTQTESTKQLMERELDKQFSEAGGGDEGGDGAPDEEMGATSGLIFAGEGVEAASVLLDSSVRKEKDVERLLSRLKGPWLGGGSRTCAFMFACCGRGAGLYRGKKNVESGVFRKLFPTTPLIGCFGGGEIGVEYIPSAVPENDDGERPAKRAKVDDGDGDGEKEKKLLSSDDLLHSYTTVFVMLSFK